MPDSETPSRSLPLDAEDAIALVQAHASGATVSDAQRRLGSALRSLTRHALDPTVDDAARNELAEQVEAIVADLPPHGTSRFSADERQAFFETAAPLINLRGGHPVFGQGTASGIDVVVEVDAERRLLIARFAYDTRHEGIPGWAHGGHVAAMFDYLLGQTCLAVGGSGPTGTLTIRFEAPTPIDTPLRYEGEVVERRGRKLYAEGKIIDVNADRVAAAAQAVFISGSW